MLSSLNSIIWDTSFNSSCSALKKPMLCVATQIWQFSGTILFISINSFLWIAVLRWSSGSSIIKIESVYSSFRKYKSRRISTTSFSPEDNTLYSNAFVVSSFLKKNVPCPASIFPRLSTLIFKQLLTALFSSPIICAFASDGRQSLSFIYLSYFIFNLR